MGKNGGQEGGALLRPREAGKVWILDSVLLWFLKSLGAVAIWEGGGFWDVDRQVGNGSRSLL